jgi:hypothetical protein
LQRRPQTGVFGQSRIGPQIGTRWPLIKPSAPFLGTERLFCFPNKIDRSL